MTYSKNKDGSINGIKYHRGSGIEPEEPVQSRLKIL